jgi:prophage tail gpP-like protein
MSPDDARDLVRLNINGRVFDGWTANSITMSIDNCADAFSVSCPFDPTDANLRAALKPFGLQSVQLYIGDDLLLTGYIEKIDPNTDATGRICNVQGRSKTGQLIDCSVEDCSEMYGLSLSTIARQVCKPFGVLVRADADTNPIEIARPECGQSVYDFLNSLAAPRNVLLNSSYDGRLVLSYTKAVSERKPVARLVEGQGICLSVQASFDATKRYSSYNIASQFAGDSYDGSVSDPVIKLHRPKVLPAEDFAQDPNQTAARARAVAIADSQSITTTVSGWRNPDNGLRWAERQVVTLKAPGAMLYTETAYIVAGVTLKIDPSEGKVTELRLMLPEAYSVDRPKVEPWD